MEAVEREGQQHNLLHLELDAAVRGANEPLGVRHLRLVHRFGEPDEALHNSIRSPGEPGYRRGSVPDRFLLVFESGFTRESLREEWALSTENVQSYELRTDGAVELANLTPAEDGFGTVTLTRTLDPLGDFILSADLAWRTRHVADTCDVLIQLIGHDGNLMLQFGYSDGWVDWYGSLFAVFNLVQRPRRFDVTTGPHSMPLAGAVSFEVIRVGERTAVFRDGEEFGVWSTYENLAEIRIELSGRRHIDPRGRRARTAPAAVHSVTLHGVPAD